MAGTNKVPRLSALYSYIQSSTVHPAVLVTIYSGTSVYELNPFLEAVREPKCS
jgi:hypothetical protein